MLLGLNGISGSIMVPMIAGGAIGYHKAGAVGAITGAGIGGGLMLALPLLTSKKESDSQMGTGLIVAGAISLGGAYLGYKRAGWPGFFIGGFVANMVAGMVAKSVLLKNPTQAAK